MGIDADTLVAPASTDSTFGRESQTDAPLDTAVPLKVLIADDHPLILLGIRRMLEAHEDIEVVGAASSPHEALALIERRRPDVVLTDLRMPGVQGAGFIAQIKQSWPSLKVVVLSACDDRPSVDGALLAGANAYIVKSVNAIDVASVLRQIGSGAVYHAAAGKGAAAGGDDTEHVGPSGSLLTDRESTLLGAIAAGLTTKRISSDLWVSEHTVKFHLTNIYRKLGVANRSGAVRYAIEHDLAA
jgi:DNA-binding NarL/FixJ family response regulator